MTDLVSIVMPVYNGAEFIKEAIESVLNQQYRNIQLIIVDDGSTDETANIVNEFVLNDMRVSYFYQSNSGGCASPRNTGLSMSAGKYICFFDADDIMLPQKIQIQVACLQGHEDVHAVFCDYQNFNNHGKYDGTHFETCIQLKQLAIDNGLDGGTLFLDTISAPRLLAVENFTISNAPLFRKKTLELMGGYNTSLKASEDWFLHMQMVSSFKSAVIPFVGFERRMHNNNMSSNNFKMLEHRAKTREMASDMASDLQTRSILKRQSAMYWYELSKEMARKKQPDAFSTLVHGIRVHRRISLDGLIALAKIVTHFIF